jgi:putative aldouronate transport system substrate-binding protein
MLNDLVHGTPDRVHIMSKAKDKLPGIMRWVDLHFDPVISCEIAMGPIGTHLEKVGNMYKYRPTPEGQNYPQFRYGATPVSAPHYIAESSWDTLLEVMDEDKPRLPWFYGELAPCLSQAFIFSYPIAEETRFLQGQGLEIENYIKTNLAKWLIQGGIERDWDGFQAQLKTMGVDQYTRIMQAQVDRFSQYAFK